MYRHQSSIVHKLTGLNMLVSGTALLLACLAFGVYDRSAFLTTQTQNLSIQAQIVASNSVSAIMFNDPAAAEVTLSALSASPHIVAAAIYTPNRQLFAEYRRDLAAAVPVQTIAAGDQTPPRPISSDSLVLARPIIFQGKNLGTVSIESDPQELTARRNQYIRAVAAVFMASLVMALVMSSVSQRGISQPIVHLAELTKAVSRNQDYSLRANITATAREMSMLVDTFNDMLGQIQARDRSLLSAQNELEERVRERTAELKTVNQELEAFSYSVSHDLRAPLRHVTGFSTLLEAHAAGKLDEQSLKYLHTIAASGRRMAQLIDDLLAFSRVGRAAISKHVVNLPDLVAEARQEVTGPAAADARDIEWHVGPLPRVRADAAMLRLVLVNLLSNAVKYSSTRPHTRIEIGTTPGESNEVVMFVRDNGVGFDMRYVDKLFGVFQRLHRANEFEGTGIGLANVKRIISRHGGRVWAESELDHGATFYFSLPRAEDVNDGNLA